MKNIITTIVFGMAIFFLIITFSIGLPIYFRPFYYLHVNALNLTEITGYDYHTIKQAFDQVMNYLTLPGVEFGTGVFAFTEAGKSHFADCKVLFNLNVSVLIASTVITTAILILKRKGKVQLLRPFGMHVAFISAISIFGVFALLIGLVSIDFNNAFTVFHKIFFPGKDNWTFNPHQDQIINVLPQQFFMNCAILIASSIIIISLTIIIVQLIKKKKLNVK